MPELNPGHVLLVARREYLEIVRNRWFVVMTILTPILMIAWSVVPSMLMMRKTSAQRTIAIVSADEQLAQDVSRRLQAQPAPISSTGAPQAESIQIAYTIRLVHDTSESTRATLQQKIDTHELDGFLWLDRNALDSREITYTARFTNDDAEMRKLLVAVRDAIRGRAFAPYGINEEQVTAALKPVELEMVHWEQGRAKKSNLLSQFLTLLVLGLAMFLSVMVYGMSVMRAVLEEKTNRLVEVLLSSLTSTELMIGKILGVGGAGLTQLAAWTAMATALALSGLAFSRVDFRLLNLGPSSAFYFASFFFLGFLLYAAISAAVGALVNSEREAQQIQQFVMMPLVASFVFMLLAMRAPNEPIITVMSMIPFFAPLLMYMRVLVDTPPAWQIALSVSLMVAAIILLFLVAGRVYRMGVLMYGKRVTLPEIIKWIRHA